MNALGPVTALPAADSEPAPEQILECLNRILASDDFSGSAQLSRFLRFVVESRLSTEGAPLKESSIGVSVFRRGASYDPKVDPIVRVEARRLRARLGSYYQGAGAADEIRISLPKGGYTPEFTLGTPQIQADAVPLPPQPTVPEARKRPPSRTAVRATVAAVLLAAIAAACLVRYATAPERLITRFWNTLLDAGRPALIIPADSGLVMLQDLVHRPALLRDYISGEYRTRLAISGDLEPRLVEALGQRRYTSIADLNFALSLSRRPEAAHRGVRTRYARDLRLEELRANNVILLGARHSNPWVELFEPDAAFRIEHDEATATFHILTSNPGPGEAADIVISPAELKQRIYGIISFHKNREGTGFALIVGGTSVAGTEAAAALLLDDTQLLPWLRKAEAHGTIRGFDILLRDRNLASGAPRAEVAAFRVEP